MYKKEFKKLKVIEFVSLFGTGMLLAGLTTLHQWIGEKRMTLNLLNSMSKNETIK